MTASVVHRQEIRSLTGLRGVAACLVVAYHFAETGVRSGGFGDRIIGHGYLSVDLFFVLSGFVMALSYRSLFASSPTAKAYPAFLLRRVARVYPLYLVVMLITGVQDVRHMLQHHISLLTYGPEFVANLFFLDGVGFSDRIVGSSWSVGAEFAAYLMLPVLLLATAGISRAAISVTLSYIAVLLLAYPPFGTSHGISGPLDLAEAYSTLPVIRCIAEFTIGLALFTCIDAVRSRFKSQLSSAVLMIAIVCVLAMPSGDVLFVLLSPLLIASLLNDTIVTRAFAWRPVFFMGELSYAIYLWHRILFGFYNAIFARLSAHSGHIVAKLGAMAGYWVILICVAYASYRLIEVPGRRFVRSIEKRMFPAEDAAIRVQEEKTSAALVSDIGPGQAAE